MKHLVQVAFFVPVVIDIPEETTNPLKLTEEQYEVATQKAVDVINGRTIVTDDGIITSIRKVRDGEPIEG